MYFVNLKNKIQDILVSCMPLFITHILRLGHQQLTHSISNLS